MGLGPKHKWGTRDMDFDHCYPLIFQPYVQKCQPTSSTFPQPTIPGVGSDRSNISNSGGSNNGNGGGNNSSNGDNKDGGSDKVRMSIARVMETLYTIQ